LSHFKTASNFGLVIIFAVILFLCWSERGFTKTLVIY